MSNVHETEAPTRYFLSVVLPLSKSVIAGLARLLCSISLEFIF